MSQVKATAKAVRTSARKMGLVAALIRGRTTHDALVILEHTPKRAARILVEVIKSAIANAENNHKMHKDKLVIDSVLVSPGMVIKRVRMGSRGHIDKNNHRTAHVTVMVSEHTPIADSKPKQISKKIKQPVMAGNK